MKKYIKIIPIILLSLTWGCDVSNYDPDAISKIPDAKVLLPAAQFNIAANLMGWDMGFAGGFWSQYWTQSYSASQFKTLCEYQPEKFESAYSSLYAGALADLERIKELTKENSENTGLYYVSEVLQIYTWQVITDLWGDMPYFEALQSSNGVLNPKIDKGQDIYKDLIKRIDKVLAMDVSSAEVSKKYDFIYAGDMAEWEAFANSLKLKLMLRLSETPTYDNAALLSFVQSANLLSSSAKISGNVWGNEGNDGKCHPMREFQLRGANYLSTNVVACKTFFDYLEKNNDPRLAKLFIGTEAAFFGDFDSKDDSDGDGTTDDKEDYAKSSFTASTMDAKELDLMLMSAWEVNFYVAEVYARANDMVNAKKHYDKGVEESMDQHGITGSTITDTGGYAEWTATTVEDGIKQIAMQKWVANCNFQHIESFLERNRTHYPSVNTIDIAANRSAAFTGFPVGEMTLSVKGRKLLNDNLPASILYPDALITRNINAPSQKVNIAEKVWWNIRTSK